MSASSQFKINFVWKRILSTSDSALIAVAKQVSLDSGRSRCDRTFVDGVHPIVDPVFPHVAVPEDVSRQVPVELRVCGRDESRGDQTSCNAPVFPSASVGFTMNVWFA